MELVLVILCLLVVVLASLLILPARAARAGAVTRGIETAETAPPATASVFKQPFSPQSAAGLRKRRGPGATRPSEQPRQPGGQEKENVNPAHDSSPQPWRSRDAGTDAAVVAMWERSVRDIFAALADEEGSSTFGFRVTAEKNPKDGDLPAIVLPSKQSAPATRRTEPRPIFMAAGSAKPPEPEFLLSAVNGQPVSGMTAQEIKDLVNRRRLLLKLDLVSGKDKRKERRLVWCRRVQTLEKVKTRLDAFLNTQVVADAACSTEGRRGLGLELLRDGLHRLLQLLESSLNAPGDSAGSEAGEENEEKRFAAMLKDIVDPQDSDSITLAHHIMATVARALSHPSAAAVEALLKASSAGTPQPHIATPLRTPMPTKEMDGGVGSHGGSTGGARASAQAGGAQAMVSRLEGEVAHLKQQLLQAQGEADKSRVEAAALEARLGDVGAQSGVQGGIQGASTAADDARARELQDLKSGLEQERKDCLHFRDLCNQLRSTKEELESHLKGEERARLEAEHSCQEVEASAAALRQQLLESEGRLSKLSSVEEQCKVAAMREREAAERASAELAAAQQRERQAQELASTAGAEVQRLRQQLLEAQQRAAALPPPTADGAKASPAKGAEPSGAAQGVATVGERHLAEELEKAREQLRWESNDKLRAVTVCTAAVEGEKERSREVSELKKRLAERDVQVAEAKKALAAASARGGEQESRAKGTEDDAVARYNLLLMHARKMQEELDAAVGRYNVLLAHARPRAEESPPGAAQEAERRGSGPAGAGSKGQGGDAEQNAAGDAKAVDELQTLRAALNAAEERERALEEAKREVHEMLEHTEEALSAVEEKYNLLLVQVREKGGRDSARLLQQHRSRDPSPQLEDASVPSSSSAASSARASPEKFDMIAGANGDHGSRGAHAGQGAGSGVRDVDDVREQKIWVMRHGEREDEVNPAWEAESQRPYDPPLTSKGRGQAYERGKGLATAMLATGSSSPCVVVSSPFLRCIQTAAEVLKGIQFVYGKQEGGQVDTRVAPTVLHLDFGLSEMQTERQMKHCKPTYLSKRELGEIEDGLDEILNRYREAFTRILSRFPESNVVCVTHGDGVASFMAQTGFTTSKDNVYETPHCSYAAASAQGQTWTPADIDPLVGFLDD